MQFSRRHCLALPALFVLPGCGTPLPLVEPNDGADDEARRWLTECAAFHGAAALRNINDINVAYAGQWRPLIDKIQPDVVDKPWRITSQERLLLQAGVMAQAHDGPAGRKHVLRTAPTGQRGDVSVWYAGQPDAREPVRTAAAMVADCYRFFLLGPLWLAAHAQRQATPLRAGTTVNIEGRLCRWVEAWLRPGLGLSAADRVSIAVDIDSRQCRRLRFTLEGHTTTRGAVAEVDWLECTPLHGVLWPTRSFERVVHPLKEFPAHDWRMTGLDLNRGYGEAALQGPQFSGAAAAAAKALPA